MREHDGRICQGCRRTVAWAGAAVTAVVFQHAHVVHVLRAVEHLLTVFASALAAEAVVQHEMAAGRQARAAV